VNGAFRFAVGETLRCTLSKTLRCTSSKTLRCTSSKTLRFSIFSAIAMVCFSCSSRNLRPDFKNQGEILRRQWTYSFEPLSSSLPLEQVEYVSPVLYENTLLFGSDRFGIISLYPKIERVRWKIEIPNGMVSQIEVHGDAAFFTGGDGNVYSVQLDTGKTLWTYALRNPVASRPTIDGEDLYIVTSDDALLSLEAKTGKWQWHYRRRNVSGPVIHGACKPLVIGDSVWVGFADGTLANVSRKDGKVLWERKLNSNKRFSSIDAEFLKVDNTVYVPAYDNALYALDARTGSPIWVKEDIGGSKQVTLVDGVLYAPSSNGNLYALNAKTGTEIWHFELDQGIPSNVVVTAKHVIFASSSEYLYALDRTTGKMVYRYQVGYGSGFSGGIAFDTSRNQLFALSRGGNLMSFLYSGK
jgi:outer membrane protein assembly factor BamB